MKPLAAVREDFDRIAPALAEAPPREVLTPAEAALLAHLPHSYGRALDVGCGDGVITRVVARSAGAVTGIDLSPRMIELAKTRSVGHANIEYIVGDIMSASAPSGPFDVVLSVSALHHVPLVDIVPRLVRLVAPGGRLLVQDVVDRWGLAYAPLNLVASLVRRVRELRRDPSGRVADLYREHGVGEEYLHARHVRAAFDELLPGATVVHHLEWRYSVIWLRPLGTPGPGSW